jgi:SAM-dependent methyltransferase
LPHLVCPVCSGGLDLTERKREGDHILEGVLRCARCRLDYEIRGGVPRMLSRPLTEEKRATADGFGYAWKTFNSLTPDYEQQFLSWIEPIGRDFFPGKLVLDCGCGKGRHLVLSAEFGAHEVIGIDLSEAVDAAFANTRHLPNVHVVQADIYELPLKREFDYVYSIGVLHHLPDPEGGFRKLVETLAPGGTISAWVYGRERNLWIIYGVNPVRERITSRIRLPVLQQLAKLVTLPLYAYARGVVLPLSAKNGIAKKLLFYQPYMEHIAQFSFREVHSIVFDHLLAPTAFYLRREEFEGWFQRAGLTDIRISWRLKNSWRGTGQRLG